MLSAILDHDYFSFQTAEVNGRLYVAWREETEQRMRILFLQQDPQGNWGNIEEVLTFTYGYGVAGLTATASGDVVILLQDGQHFSYSERRQGGWSKPEIL